MRSFLRFREFENYCFGIVFTENKDEDNDNEYFLSFDIWRAITTHSLDLDGEKTIKGYNLPPDADQDDNESILLSGFVMHPAYEVKELLNYSFYGTNIDAEEFKELSELLNSDYILKVYNESKLHHSKES